MERQQTPSQQIIMDEYITSIVDVVVKGHVFLIAPLVFGQWVASGVTNKVLNVEKSPLAHVASIFGIRSRAAGTTEDTISHLQDAAEVYQRTTKILGYLVPLLLFGKFWIVENNVARTTVDNAPSFVKDSTRYHFVLAGGIVILQNLLLKNFGIVEWLRPLRFGLDTGLLTISLVQVANKVWFLMNRK